MNSLIKSCIGTIYIITQTPYPLSEASGIQQYVSIITTNKALSTYLIGYHISPKDKSFNYAVVQDTLFYTYGTDFPCTATLYYLNNRLARVKEVINVGSAFIANQYYIKDQKLVFIEAKEIIRPFRKQSSKTKYTEKDYIFHGQYFFVSDSCIHIQEKGESRYGYGHIDSPPKNLTKPRAYFYRWQAARYVALFSRPPKRQ